MQLVGATKGFIRKPFITTSMIYGFYAGVIACVLLCGILYLIKTKLPDLFHMQDLRAMAVLFGAIVVFGILLSLLSTFFAVNRYLRLKVDELYG